MDGFETLSVSLIVVCAGILFSCVGLCFYRAYASTRWPRVKGRVITSSILINRGYKPVVKYEYSIDGHNYRSEVISPLIWAYYDKSKADVLIQKFPVATEVDVFYNPNHPKVAVLLPGIIGGFWHIYVLIIAILIIFLTNGYFAGWRKGRGYSLQERFIARINAKMSSHDKAHTP